MRVQGQTIVVDLPGVKDQDEALERRRRVRRGRTQAGAELRGLSGTGGIHDADVGTQRRRRAHDRCRPRVPAPSGSRRHQSGLRRPAVPGQTVPTTPFRPSTVPTDTHHRRAHLDDGPRHRPADRRRAPSCSRVRDGSVVCVGPAAGHRRGVRAGQRRSDRSTRVGVSRSTCEGDGQAAWNSLASQCYNAHRPVRRPSPAYAVRSRSCSTAWCSRRRR